MSLPEDTRIALFEQPDAQVDFIAAPAPDQFEAGAKAVSMSDGGALRRHRLSAAFPALKEEEYAALRESIARDGQSEAIWTLQGEILDGWHRYRACIEAGVEPRFREYEGDQPANFVLAQQAARRNWTSSQAAAVASALAADLAREAAERKREIGRATGGLWRARHRASGPTDDTKEIRKQEEHAIPLANDHEEQRVTQRIEEPSAEEARAPTAKANRQRRESADRAARVVGTNRQYVFDYREIEKADAALAEKVRDDKVSIPRAKRILRERDAAERRRDEMARNAEASRHEPILHAADFREVELPGGSVDAIVTDPPYPKEYLPLYADLAEYASRVLKPGGIVLAMAGQSWLPEIYRMMGEHLEYVWTICYATPGSSTPVWPRKARSNWKPVLLYAKDAYAGDSYVDYLSSAQAEKEHHEWGQNESGFATLIERYTKTDDLVLDPFLGGGTTGIAAVSLKRRFVGIEKDPLAYETARGRLEGLQAAGDRS